MVIGGSTASGKSALALRLAAQTGGVIVNADSQQLHAGLPTLTARPTPADEALAEHRLYGVLRASEQASVAGWLDHLAPVLAELRGQRRPIVLTGGTGLYIEALLRGLPPMPPIDPEVRRALREEALAIPAPLLHARLARRDPGMAARLAPNDTQRIVRALEVLGSTGRSLAAWQAEPPRRLPLPPNVAGIALLPPAGVVAPRIERRLEAMLEAGALAEVGALLEAHPDLARLPIAKVHGCRELVMVRRGELGLSQAAPLIAAQVRQYAKRQRTWFRHRLPELLAVEAVGEDPALAPALLERLA